MFFEAKHILLRIRRATERNCEMIKMVERGDATHWRQIFRDKSCALKGEDEAWT